MKMKQFAQFIFYETYNTMILLILDRFQITIIDTGLHADWLRGNRMKMQIIN